MSVADIIQDAHETLTNHLNTLKSVFSADQLGLDARAGATIWIDGDWIIVHQNYDRVLQYYGGFEYVEPSCRQVMGNYVLYSAEDERVAECIDRSSGLPVGDWN